MQRLAGQRIDGEFDRLAGMHARELGFLEVGDDPWVGFGERKEHLAGFHLIADFRGFIADAAVGRRGDHRVRELSLGITQFRFGRGAGGVGRLDLRAGGLLCGLGRCKAGLGGVG